MDELKRAIDVADDLPYARLCCTWAVRAK